MAMWTVHTRKAGDEVRLVRDGFRWWALALPLIWMAVKGLWTVLLIALAASILITAAGLWLELGDAVILILNLGINLIAGFEGANLERWTLERRGWHEVAAVPGDRRVDAEYRYFAARPLPQSPSIVLPRGPLPGAASDPLGLFGGTR